MSIINTLERLNVPLALIDQDGIYVQSKSRTLVCKEKFRIQSSRRTLISRTIEHVEAPVSNPQKAMALNFLSEKLNIGDYVLLDSRTLRKEGSTKILTTGYLAGQQVWFMGGTIVLTDTGYIWSFDSIYMNIDKSGQPTSGIVSLPVIQETTIPRGGTTTTFTTRTTRTFTRAEIEAMGYNSDELAAGCWQECILQKPNTLTHLVNLSTDLEPIGDNIFWPNAYLNGIDDSEADFQKLIPHYATRTPDFVFRLRAYDDRTNADYSEPNYSGFGNAGKCLDIPFENENSKPIRVVYKSTGLFTIENTPEEYILTFNINSQRIGIGLAVEFKPLDGKKVEGETYFNLKTGERTLNIKDLSYSQEQNTVLV